MRYRKLSDHALLETFTALVTRDRTTTAALLECLDEVDTRQLYLAAGHPSMFAWCVDVHHMSESTAAKRIQAARAAHRFPVLLQAVAEGRLHLTAVCLLAPHLTSENVAELVAAATHRGKREIISWLEVRFAPPILLEAAVPPGAASHAASMPMADLLGAPSIGGATEGTRQPSPAKVGHTVDVDAIASAPAVLPHVVLHVALPPATHAKLERAQRLLAHALPAGDVAAVLDRALDTLLAQVERRKLAAAKKPRQPRGPRAAKPLAPRTIPAAVKREVVARDGERCAYVAPDGRRCSARSRLEFDHMDPVARGGLASADRVRLLCRAHNQFEAERVFGRGFVQDKRRQAAQARDARARKPAEASSNPPG